MCKISQGTRDSLKCSKSRLFSSSNATFSGTKGNSNMSRNVSPLRMRKCCSGSEQLLDVRLHHMKPPSLKIQFLRSMRYVSIWKKKTVKKIPSLKKSVLSMILQVDLIQSARKSFTRPHSFASASEWNFAKSLKGHLWCLSQIHCKV